MNHCLASGTSDSVVELPIGDKLIATGRVLQPGRTWMVCLEEVLAITDGKEKLVATMLATTIAREGSGLIA